MVTTALTADGSVPLLSLYDQLKGAGWAGEWNASGVDRYKELADLLGKAGVTDLSKLGGLQWSDYTTPIQENAVVGYQGDNEIYGTLGGDQMSRAQLMYNGKPIGYLGDYNNNGTFGTKASDYLKGEFAPNARDPNGLLAAWSSQGHGNVSYRIKQGADGKIQIVPTWGTSSEAADIRTAAEVVGSVIGGGYAIDAAAGAGAATEGGSAVAGSSGGGAATGSAVSADAAGTASQTAGYWNGVDFSGSTPMSMSSATGGGSTWSSVMDWGNLLGGVLQGYGSYRAGEAQADAARHAADVSAAQRQPWVDAGKGALDRLTAGLKPGGEFAQKFSMNDALNSPAYKEALRGGEEAIQNSAAAKGGLLSSNTMQDLTKFGQATAAQFENQAFNQWLAQQEMLLAPVQSLAGIGQTEINQVADTQANALLAAGGARAGAIAGMTNAATGAYSNYANNQSTMAILNQILGNQGNVSGGGGMTYDPYGYGVDSANLGGSQSAGDFSDRRLKTDVRRVGHTDDGTPIYTYKMGQGPRKMGVMAQEVMKSKPDAVSTHPSGFLMVDYDKVS